MGAIQQSHPEPRWLSMRQFLPTGETLKRVYQVQLAVQVILPSGIIVDPTYRMTPDGRAGKSWQRVLLSVPVYCGTKGSKKSVSHDSE